MSKKIEKNMLRKRAIKLPNVTDEKWNQVLEEHRDIVEEFFDANRHLSKQSIKQYISGLRQFFWFVHIKLKDKPLHSITKRDFIKYMGYLQDNNLSSKTLSLKKSSVSTLCNFIENIIADDDERYERFRNFTKGLPAIPKNQVYSKVKVTREEYEFMMSELEKQGHYLGMAWLAVSFNCGTRKGEIRQFKTEIIDYPIDKDKNYVLSHIVRGKGKSTDGKPLQYMINFEALKYIKLWIEKRGYENEYIFTTSYSDKHNMISSAWANYFCTKILSPMLNRRINPHIFKSSCITYLLENGVDIALVSKFIAHHEDISTTANNYDLRDFENEKNEIFL